MGITPAARKEYLECGGQQCPYCGGSTTVEQSPDRDDPRLKSENAWELRVFLHCDRCSKRWVELNTRTWVPSDIEEIGEAEQAPKGAEGEQQ